MEDENREEELLTEIEQPDAAVEEEPVSSQEPTCEKQPDSFALQIEEAERRGYLRGLNEQAGRLMAMPMQGERAKPRDFEAMSEPEILILDRRRVSVWEK